MKKLMVAFAGAMAFGLSAVAADWFNGGIDAQWPDNAKAGAWSNTVDQVTVVGEKIEIDADPATPVAFNAEEAKTLGTDATNVVFTMTAELAPFTELPPIPAGAKGAVVLSNDVYFVLLANAEKTANEWAAVNETIKEGAVPVKVSIGDYADGAASIKYTINDVVVNGFIKLESLTFQSIEMTGTGTMSALAASYEQAVAPVVEYDLTISAENATVDGIVAGKVAEGSNLVFTVTANDGYTVKSVTANDVTLTDVEGQYTYTVGKENVAIVVTTEKAAEPVDPSKGGEIQCETAAQATALAAAITADPASYVKAPEGVEGEDVSTYQAMFKATASGKTVTLQLTEEAKGDLQTQIDDEVKNATGLLDANATEAALTMMTPGMYYWVKGSSDVTAITTAGEAKQAVSDDTLYLPKPEIEDTQAFFKIAVDFKRPE